MTQVLELPYEIENQAFQYLGKNDLMSFGMIRKDHDPTTRSNLDDCAKRAHVSEKIQDLEDYLLHNSGESLLPPDIDSADQDYIRDHEDLRNKVNFLALGVIALSMVYFESESENDAYYHRGISYQQASMDSDICETLLKLRSILHESYVSHFDYWKILIDVEMFV